MSLIPDPGRFHMPRSNRAGAPQLQSLNSRAREPQLLKPECLEPVLHKRTTTMRSLSTPRKSKFHSLQLEKSPHSDDPAQPKINKVKKKKSWTFLLSYPGIAFSLHMEESCGCPTQLQALFTASPLGRNVLFACNCHGAYFSGRLAWEKLLTCILQVHCTGEAALCFMKDSFSSHLCITMQLVFNYLTSSLRSTPVKSELFLW